MRKTIWSLDKSNQLCYNNIQLQRIAMHDSTLDLFDKVGIAHDDIEALATYYEVTCDYYEAEFLGLENYI